MNLKHFELINDIPYYEGMLLVVYKNSQGYSYVSIEGKKMRLHRLIAQRYLPNLFNYMVVEHLNGNKSDNRISNLKWVSYSENSKLAYKSVKAMKEMHRHAKGKPVLSIKNGVTTEHRSLRECAKFIGRNVAGVHRVLKCEWNYCNGYQLKYK
jgi:hypothetical protein